MSYPQLFAVGICIGSLPWLFAVAICHGYLSWEFAADICRSYLLLEFAVPICRGFFCVHKQIFFKSFEPIFFLCKQTFFIWKQNNFYFWVSLLILLLFCYCCGSYGPPYTLAFTWESGKNDDNSLGSSDLHVR